jgi:hypothetical protein
VPVGSSPANPVTRGETSQSALGFELLSCILRIHSLKVQLETLEDTAVSNTSERSRIVLAASLIDKALRTLSEPREV